MIIKTLTLDVTAPSGTFPTRHLEAYVQEVLRRYPDQAEQNTLRTTLEGGTLRTTIEHTLSPAEEVADLQARLAEQEQARLALVAMLPPDGHKMSAEAVTRMRQALGAIAPTGTQAPAAPPAVPNVAEPPAAPPTDDQRRSAFFDWARATMFKIPGDERAVWTSCGNVASGIWVRPGDQAGTASDVERWLVAPQGSIARGAGVNS